MRENASVNITKKEPSKDKKRIRIYSKNYKYYGVETQKSTRHIKYKSKLLKFLIELNKEETQN